MDSVSRTELAGLVRNRGLASLGTVYRGAPLVTFVLYACASESTDLIIHVSRLAQHTEGLLAESRVGLMIAEADRPPQNPLSLSRVSIQGTATLVEAGTPAFAAARAAYLAAHPRAEIHFQLPDFLLFLIRPLAIRFIAGFGRIFDLDEHEWQELWVPRNFPRRG